MAMDEFDLQCLLMKLVETSPLLHLLLVTMPIEVGDLLRLPVLLRVVMILTVDVGLCRLLHVPQVHTTAKAPLLHPTVHMEAPDLTAGHLRIIRPLVLIMMVLEDPLLDPEALRFLCIEALAPEKNAKAEESVGSWIVGWVVGMRGVKASLKRANDVVQSYAFFDLFVFKCFSVPFLPCFVSPPQYFLIYAFSLALPEILT